MSSSSIAQENRNSPPFLSPLHGPETETRKTPACNLFALSGFTAFRKGWALLSQEKGGDDEQEAEPSADIMSRTSMSVEPGILQTCAFLSITTSSPGTIQKQQLSLATPGASYSLHMELAVQRVHRYREKQEGLTVTPPQLKFKILLQCTHFQSVLGKGDNLSLRSSFCLSGGQWGGCAHAQVFQLHAQRATDALQNIHHLFCGEISYCKIRE